MENTKNFLIYGSLAHQESVYTVYKVLRDSSVQSLLQELFENDPEAKNTTAMIDDSFFWFQMNEQDDNPSVFTIRYLDNEAADIIEESGEEFNEIDFADMSSPLSGWDAEILLGVGSSYLESDRKAG